MYNIYRYLDSHCTVLRFSILPFVQVAAQVELCNDSWQSSVSIGICVGRHHSVDCCAIFHLGLVIIFIGFHVLCSISLACLFIGTIFKDKINQVFYLAIFTPSTTAFATQVRCLTICFLLFFIQVIRNIMIQKRTFIVLYIAAAVSHTVIIMLRVHQVILFIMVISLSLSSPCTYTDTHVHMFLCV